MHSIFLKIILATRELKTENIERNGAGHRSRRISVFHFHRRHAAKPLRIPGSLPIIAFLLVGLLLAQDGRADLVGDTYSLGIVGLGADENVVHHLNSQNVFTVQTFDGSGTAKVIGDSRFGNKNGGGAALDEFAVSESLSSLSALKRQVIIDVFARNKTSLLKTNWIADGATTDGGADTFVETAIELGIGSGGTDRLKPMPFVVLDSSEFRFLGTDGLTYGSFPINNPLVGDQFGGAGGVFLGLGSDFATFEVAAGVEFAGYQLRYI